MSVEDVMRAKELIDDPVLEDELPQAVLILAAQLCKVREAKNGNGDNAQADRLLNIDEAAVRLDVPPSWLYRHSRQLSFAIRNGRKLAFSEKGIEEYIRKNMGR
jgi:predicted DNA-binding transcriptional regulator AlpA